MELGKHTQTQHFNYMDKKLERKIMKEENEMAHLSSAMFNDEVDGYSTEYLTTHFSRIHLEATTASVDAVNLYLKNFKEKNPEDPYGEPSYCGFAWVRVFDIKLNTRLGKNMKANKFEKFWTRGSIFLWNPSNYHGQSMDVKECGAVAYAEVLRKYGFKAYMGSRAD